jgi:predicted Zn-dependent protease
MIFRLFINSTLILAGLGCSTSTVRLPYAQEISTNSSNRLADPEIQKNAKILGGTIIGQLSLVNEDLPVAAESLQEALDLLGDKVDKQTALQLAEIYLMLNEPNKSLATLNRIDEKLKDSVVLLLEAGLRTLLNDKQGAILKYAYVQSLAPDRIDAPLLRAYLEGGKKGEEVLQRYVDTHKKDPRSYLFLARYLEDEGDIESAESTLIKGIKLIPNKKSLIVAKARILMKLGKNTEAVELLSKSKKSFSAKNKDILINLLQREIELDKVDSTTKEPYVLRHRLAELLINEKEFQRAGHELYLVLIENPEFELARYNLATMYASLGARDQAVTELLMIRPESDLFIRSRVFGALLKQQQLDSPEAIKILQDSIAISEKDSPELKSLLISLLQESKNSKAAEEVFLNTIKEQPEDVKIRFEYALFLQENNRIDEAGEEVEEILEEDPTFLAAKNYLAYTLAESGENLDYAKQLVDQALVAEPQNAYYIDTLAWIYFKQGDLVNALKYLKLANEIVDNDPVLLEHYGDVLVQSGKVDLAKNIYNRALVGFELVRDRNSSGSNDMTKEEAIERVLLKLENLTH